MSAAALIRKAREAGLSLAVTETGNVRVKGPRTLAERWAPEIVANKQEIIAELSSQTWLEPRIRCEPPFGCDHVPARYRHAWDALLSQCPPAVTPIVWQAAIFDAALLFGDFGKLIDEHHWLSNDLFAVPYDDVQGGLVWFIKGSPIVAIGRHMAQSQDGRIWRKAGR
jgi:hypothetical protein